MENKCKFNTEIPDLVKGFHGKDWLKYMNPYLYKEAKTID
jgi:hypothetical protein